MFQLWLFDWLIVLLFKKVLCYQNLSTIGLAPTRCLFWSNQSNQDWFEKQDVWLMIVWMFDCISVQNGFEKSKFQHNWWSLIPIIVSKVAWTFCDLLAARFSIQLFSCENNSIQDINHFNVLTSIRWSGTRPQLSAIFFASDMNFYSTNYTEMSGHTFSLTSLAL